MSSQSLSPMAAAGAVRQACSGDFDKLFHAGINGAIDAPGWILRQMLVG